jgi:hypothetical protein
LACGVWIGFDCSGQGPVAGCCECGDEPSGSCATELVSYRYLLELITCLTCEWNFFSLLVHMK